jgi:hypothetical protein
MVHRAKQGTGCRRDSGFALLFDGPRGQHQADCAGGFLKTWRELYFHIFGERKFMEKKITVAATVLSLCGLISEYVGIGEFGFVKFSLRIIDTGTPTAFGEVNEWNLLAHGIFLAAAVLYFFSSFRESRFLRFVFSIVFFQKAISVLFGLAYFFFAPDKTLWLLVLAHLVINLIVGTVSLLAVKNIGKRRVLEMEVTQYGELRNEVLIPATKWQRVFHLIMDLLVFFFIFYPLLENIIRNEIYLSSIRWLEATFGDRGGLIVLAIMARSIYYITFEALFNATPAKILTENRVTDQEGNKPEFPVIVGRTFSRFVPLEALSFLGSTGWHDQWSRTEVIREKRIGIKGSYYFLIIPITLFVTLGYYMITTAYKKQQQTKKYEAEFAEEVRQFDYLLQNINSNTVIALKDLSYGPTMYIKAEEVKKDTVVFSVIQKEKPDDGTARYEYDRIDEREIEPLYAERKDKFWRVPIARADLAKAVNRKPGDYYYNGVELLDVNKRYRIESIEDYFAPRLKLNDTYGRSEDYASISLTNWGWPADIIAIKGGSGDIKWSFENDPRLPVRIGRNKYNRLTGRGDDIEEYVVQLTLRDTLNRIQVYEIVRRQDDMPKMKRIR